MKPDSRLTTLASNIVNYSVSMKPGDKVYIDMVGADSQPLVEELVRAVTDRGGIPFWATHDDSLASPFFRNASEAQFEEFSKLQASIMEQMDCYVGIRAQSNPFELIDLDADRQKWKQTHWWKKVHSDVRLKKRWCVLRYPSAAMAALAQKSVPAFEDFYFKVCNLDYQKMSDAMDSLVARLQRTKRVRLVSPGTDIEFSIEGLPAIKCAGKFNLPDGEVFTAPVMKSMNGVISYNTTSFYQGTLFKDIRLEVREGRIVNATCTTGGNEALNKIFDTDEGGRYFGEFAIGVNPFVLDPMNDTLFDEKIAGSIHLTPGSSYDDCCNGNKSAVHWDLVLIQRPEFGGGEIFFDGECVRRDGLFVAEDLKCLNPQALS